MFLREAKKKQLEAPDDPIDINIVSHGVLKDIEYFKKNLNVSPKSNQIVNYTWEKPSNESPSIYGPLFNEYQSKDLNKRHQNTLELMATYRGNPHCVKQNRWDVDPNGPPEFKDVPQKRRTAVQSAMTQYYIAFYVYLV